MGKQDLEIARTVTLKPIQEIGAAVGLAPGDLEPYGHYKAKVGWDAIARRRDHPDGALVLVTAMTPTPAGEGKSTTTVGLADGLRRLGKRAVVALREPSLGPVFGMKGGATGGGRAQLAPMEDINLHRSEEHTSELQSRLHLVCRLLLEKKKKIRALGLKLVDHQSSAVK